MTSISNGESGASVRSKINTLFTDFANRGAKEVKDLATLQADTSLTYTTGQDGTVAAGDIVRTRAEGFAYEVLAFDASGDITNSNGTPVQLRVLPFQNGSRGSTAYGALGDGATGDSTALDTLMQEAIAAGVDVEITPGTYLLDAKLGEYQSSPVVVRGRGEASTLHINNADNTGFDIGSIGGNDAQGGARIITLFEDLNWTTETKTDETPVRAIDAQSVNPVNVTRNRFYGLGPEAVKLRQIYYGSIRDSEFVKSGLLLQNVNNFLMSGGGFFWRGHGPAFR